MIYFKACPRCSGDVKTGSDIAGAFARCLQCGFVRDLPSESHAGKLSGQLRELIQTAPQIGSER